MCKVLEVSRSGYYRWSKSQNTIKQQHQNRLLIWIKEIYEKSKGLYGSRRITKALKRNGINCYNNQVSKIMRINGIMSKRRLKYRITTNSIHKHRIAPNILEREFTVSQANKVWVGDITYIWTKEGWAYLSTVIDLFSRKVVGWSINQRINTELVKQSFTQAIQQRHPENGLIFHSDRGVQYASEEFRNILAKEGVIQSMSRKGNCWDNAVAESFFKTLKSELISWCNFKSRQEAEIKIFEYIEIYYNRWRLHSTNNYLSPNDYELKYLA